MSLFSTKEVHLEMVVTLVVRVCMCVFLLVTVSLLLSVRNICCTYGVVICLERGADLHMAQLMPMPLASVKSRGPIYKISYDYLTIMARLRSTYDRRLIHKTSYEGRKAFLRYNSLAKIVKWSEIVFIH